MMAVDYKEPHPDRWLVLANGDTYSGPWLNYDDARASALDAVAFGRVDEAVVASVKAVARFHRRFLVVPVDEVQL